MKHYPKIHEDILNNWDVLGKYVGSATGSIEDLANRFRSFYNEAHREIFMHIVKEVWLEQQILINGKKRLKRMGNGIFEDLCYGKFTKYQIGISQRVLTSSTIFHPVATYLIDFFPDFLKNDPFAEPEKYEFPYKNITLDFLYFVHMVDDRLDLLKHAEDKKMKYAEFVNWTINWVNCYNLEKGKDIYEIGTGHWEWQVVKKIGLKRGWDNKKFLFDTHYNGKN